MKKSIGRRVGSLLLAAMVTLSTCEQSRIIAYADEFDEFEGNGFVDDELGKENLLANMVLVNVVSLDPNCMIGVNVYADDVNYFDKNSFAVTKGQEVSISLNADVPYSMYSTHVYLDEECTEGLSCVFDEDVSEIVYPIAPNEDTTIYVVFDKIKATVNYDEDRIEEVIVGWDDGDGAHESKVEGHSFEYDYNASECDYFYKVKTKNQAPLTMSYVDECGQRVTLDVTNDCGILPDEDWYIIPFDRFIYYGDGAHEITFDVIDVEDFVELSFVAGDSFTSFNVCADAPVMLNGDNFLGNEVWLSQNETAKVKKGETVRFTFDAYCELSDECSYRVYTEPSFNNQLIPEYDEEIESYVYSFKAEEATRIYIAATNVPITVMYNEESFDGVKLDSFSKQFVESGETVYVDGTLRYSALKVRINDGYEVLFKAFIDGEEKILSESEINIFEATDSEGYRIFNMDTLLSRIGTSTIEMITLPKLIYKSTVTFIVDEGISFDVFSLGTITEGESTHEIKASDEIKLYATNIEVKDGYSVYMYYIDSEGNEVDCIDGPIPAGVNDIVVYAKAIKDKDEEISVPTTPVEVSPVVKAITCAVKTALKTVEKMATATKNIVKTVGKLFGKLFR